eukprot:CAMPEP_0197259542 /NCGR_PEP_ID=MMETSP1429-20130617/83565_1 /TAXON_ID=49237 /ORGANISM="Chaetoceros  sp., Strain UNC1202" /LENGTH=483 /DNA_ID=CAMNT_0042723751 /DNA_START=59 /DNA_END=1507 /DNA_ORIENTATION=-
MASSKPHAHDDESGLTLLASISSAILPFARSLVLLLRAATSAIRQRNKQVQGPVDDFLESEDTMYIEDGIYFMKNLGCPMPSDIMSLLSDESSRNSSDLDWAHLINCWIYASISLDAYHGSHGDHLKYDPEKQKWIPALTKHDRKTKEGSMKKSEDTNVMLYETVIEVDYNPIDESMEEDDSDDEYDGTNIVMPMAFGDLTTIDSAVDVDGLDFDDDEMEYDGVFGMATLSSQNSQDTAPDASDESKASVYSWDKYVGPQAVDDLYANVSTSAIIPYQPSFLGSKDPGPGPRGLTLDCEIASSLMSDSSHLGLIHYPVTSAQGPGLIRLPHSFVELYSLANEVKGSGRSSMDAEDDSSSTETALCLMTGTILRAGASRRGYRSRNRAPGACTLHSRKFGSGTGIFFLLQKCTVLLVHNKKAAYSASLYVDENGEEDPGLSRGMPLFLKEERYEALTNLWRQHGIPGEVAQIRSTSDRVIRDNW